MCMAYGCGLLLAFIFGQGLNFSASYLNEHSTYLLLIFMVIWYKNLCLIKLKAMVKKF